LSSRRENKKRGTAFSAVPLWDFLTIYLVCVLTLKSATLAFIPPWGEYYRKKYF
jgi:hypothetical protein